MVDVALRRLQTLVSVMEASCAQCPQEPPGMCLEWQGMQSISNSQARRSPPALVLLLVARGIALDVDCACFARFTLFRVQIVEECAVQANEITNVSVEHAWTLDCRGGPPRPHLKLSWLRGEENLDFKLILELPHSDKTCEDSLTRTLLPGLACTAQLWHQCGDRRVCVCASLPWTTSVRSFSDGDGRRSSMGAYIHVRLSNALLLTAGDRNGYDVKVTRLTLWGNALCSQKVLPWCALVTYS